ncbi:metalloregulator ArsR/SmtB family transcription factor [Williamsia sp. MIQD14]|uniref:metalloregulator ArsR/SmtB family transcription factor n=1 Tax=Williamsia sp. MIQD14 TaxID=3425703 RepID=UPI003DA08E79
MSNQTALSAERCGPPLVREPLTPTSSVELATMFKAIADPVRLRLLSQVAAHDGGQACVCDISGAVDVSQPTVSHHLKVLREAGLLESERRGTWVHYRVVPAALQTLSSFLGSASSSAAVPT